MSRLQGYSGRLQGYSGRLQGLGGGCWRWNDAPDSSDRIGVQTDFDANDNYAVWVGGPADSGPPQYAFTLYCYEFATETLTSTGCYGNDGGTDRYCDGGNISIFLDDAGGLYVFGAWLPLTSGPVNNYFYGYFTLPSLSFSSFTKVSTFPTNPNAWIGRLGQAHDYNNGKFYFYDTSSNLLIRWDLSSQTNEDALSLDDVYDVSYSNSNVYVLHNDTGTSRPVLWKIAAGNFSSNTDLGLNTDPSNSSDSDYIPNADGSMVATDVGVFVCRTTALFEDPDPFVYWYKTDGSFLCKFADRQDGGLGDGTYIGNPGERVLGYANGKIYFLNGGDGGSGWFLNEYTR